LNREVRGRGRRSGFDSVGCLYQWKTDWPHNSSGGQKNQSRWKKIRNGRSVPTRGCLEVDNTGDKKGVGGGEKMNDRQAEKEGVSAGPRGPKRGKCVWCFRRSKINVLKKIGEGKKGAYA